jgi:formate dehydrogenase subunit gamma
VDFDADKARDIVAAHQHLSGAVLPTLRALQETFGYIDERAERIVAEGLNVTRAEVHGVLTFYHDFRRKPGGRHLIRLCRAEACQAAGGEALVAQAEAELGVPCGETTADGASTLEAVYCLGLCAVAPAGMIDGRPIGRLEQNRLAALLSEVRR